MFDTHSPKWIRSFEKRLSWLAVPNIAFIFVTLQAIGFLFVMMDPIWVMRLALVPELVKAGEFWRLVTFLALPLSTSPIWVIFSLWFLYFVIDSIESVWGSFRTTFYTLIAILLMIGFSFSFDYPISEISGFESTLFLAAASLFPERMISIFFVLPVKMIWLAWLTMALVVFKFLSVGWIEKLYILAIYSNYLIFFGPAQAYQIKQRYRKWQFKNKMRQ